MQDQVSEYTVMLVVGNSVMEMTVVGMNTFSHPKLGTRNSAVHVRLVYSFWFIGFFVLPQ